MRNRTCIKSIWEGKGKEIRLRARKGKYKDGKLREIGEKRQSNAAKKRKMERRKGKREKKDRYIKINDMGETERKKENR